MYVVYHGSWRDFTTAVGVFSIRVLFASLARHPRWRLVNDWRRFIANAGSWTRYRRAVRGKLLAGKCLWGNVPFASLTRHTLRLWALTRPSAQPTVPCQRKGAVCWAITYERLFICRVCSNKLTTANLCDIKNAEVCARDTMTHQWVCVTRASFCGGYTLYRLWCRVLFDRDWTWAFFEGCFPWLIGDTRWEISFWAWFPRFVLAG